MGSSRTGPYPGRTHAAPAGGAATRKDAGQQRRAHRCSPPLRRRERYPHLPSLGPGTDSARGLRRAAAARTRTGSLRSGTRARRWGAPLLFPVAATREHAPARRPQGVRCAASRPLPPTTRRVLAEPGGGEEEGLRGTALQASGDLDHVPRRAGPTTGTGPGSRAGAVAWPGAGRGAAGKPARRQARPPASSSRSHRSSYCSPRHNDSRHQPAPIRPGETAQQRPLHDRLSAFGTKRSRCRGPVRSAP